MHKVKLSFLEEFRSLRTETWDKSTNEMPVPADDLFVPSMSGLVDKIKGVYRPPNVMVIDSLIHEYLYTSQDKNQAFELYPQEIEHLRDISEKIGKWMLGMRIYYAVAPDIIIEGEIPLIRGKIGGEVKIGMEFTDINDYDDTISRKVYCSALQLYEFNLFYIGYWEFRPHSFKLSTFQFYPSPESDRKEILEECQLYIAWCKANGLEKYIRMY